MQRGPAREWVTQEPVQRKISAIFRKFLRDFTDEHGELVYRQRMRDMVTSAAQTSGLGLGSESVHQRRMGDMVQTAAAAAFPFVRKPC